METRFVASLWDFSRLASPADRREGRAVWRGMHPSFCLDAMNRVSTGRLIFMPPVTIEIRVVGFIFILPRSGRQGGLARLRKDTPPLCYPNLVNESWYILSNHGTSWFRRRSSFQSVPDQSTNPVNPPNPVHPGSDNPLEEVLVAHLSVSRIGAPMMETRHDPVFQTCKPPTPHWTFA